MSKIYDFKNKDIKIEFNSIKIGNSAYINQPIEVIEYIEYLQNQLQQKENTIKEVREYIEKNWISQKYADNYRFDYEELNIEISDIAVLFDILDKEVN